MALRAISQVCTSGTGSGPSFRCVSQAAPGQFPQLEGKVEDGFTILGRGGRFFISGPGLSSSVPFNPKQSFSHPGTGRIIYKHEPGVLTGISSILGPLAAAGATIFQSQQNISLQRARLKQGLPALPQQRFTQQQVAPKSNTGIILIVVVAIVVIGGFLMMQSNDDKK